jgi:transcriptional regulator with XRE-family HTH domain
MTPAWSFGDRLRKARRSADMTTAQFAGALGITVPSLSQYETDRAVPRDIVGLAKRVEQVTGVSALWLLDLTEQPDAPQLALAS